MDDDRNTRCQAVIPGNTGAAVLINPSDFGPHRAEFKRAGHIIDNGKNIGIMHEIIDAALLQERMSKGDDLVLIDIGNGPDSTEFHIAIDKCGCHGTARFQRHGLAVFCRRSRIDGHKLVLGQLLFHPVHRYRIEAAGHERRIDGDQ